MDWQLFREVILGLLTVLLGVIGYLLKLRDDSQEAARKEDNERIDKLFETSFKKHDEDVAELTSLRREIDKNHYERGDVDRLFGRMETTVKEGFKGLGDKMDILSKEITDIATKVATHIGSGE